MLYITHRTGRPMGQGPAEQTLRALQFSFATTTGARFCYWGWAQYSGHARANVRFAAVSVLAGALGLGQGNRCCLYPIRKLAGLARCSSFLLLYSNVWIMMYRYYIIAQCQRSSDAKLGEQAKLSTPMATGDKTRYKTERGSIIPDCCLIK